MRCDYVSLVARNDKLISDYGTRMYNKHGHDTSQHQYIRCKIRELARFLMVARNHGFESLESVIEPTRFNQVISVMEDLCGYCEGKATYKNPSLALKLGHSLKKCASIQKVSGMLAEDESMQKKAKRFLTLCAETWTDQVSSRALTNLYEAKFNKPNLLPLTDDIVRLHRYLDEQSATLMKRLEAGDSSVWGDLCQVLLSRLILFNRRRCGEIGKMEMKFYQDRSDVNHDICSLTQFARVAIHKSRNQREERTRCPCASYHQYERLC